MKRPVFAPHFLLIAGAVLAAAGISGCFPSDQSAARECYLSLQVHDSLYAFDTVVINLVDPATQSVRKSIWNAPLPSDSALRQIPSGDYCGEPVDVSITAVQRDSSRPYRRLVHFRGASGNTVVEILPAIPAPKAPPSPTVLLFTAKDAPIDTTVGYNNGLSAAFPLPTQTGSAKVFLFKFDLSRIDPGKLKSGKLHLNVYVGGSNPVSGTVPLTCRIYGIHSEWQEGTGNWYYHREGWRNGGEQMFAHYPLPDSIKALSTDPAERTGIDSSAKEMLRMSSATLIATESVSLDLPAFRVVKTLPARADLADLAIDMTGYLKTARPEQDFGWMITVDQLPTGIFIGTLSKEIGDGTLGPRLALDY